MIVDLKNKLPEELENLSAADFVMVQEGEQIMDEKFQTKPIGFFKDAGGNCGRAIIVDNSMQTSIENRYFFVVYRYESTMHEK